MTHAVTNVPDAIVKSGVRTRIMIAWDCDQPSHAPIVWAHADHGTVTVTKGRGPSCGLSSMNIAEIYYKSNRGFKGTDTLHLLGIVTNGKLDRTGTIVVR